LAADFIHPRTGQEQTGVPWAHAFDKAFGGGRLHADRRLEDEGKVVARCGESGRDRKQGGK
jgi:hypothetical protein